MERAYQRKLTDWGAGGQLWVFTTFQQISCVLFATARNLVGVSLLSAVLIAAKHGLTITMPLRAPDRVRGRRCSKHCIRCNIPLCVSSSLQQL